MLNVAQILSGATAAGAERIALRSGDLAMTVEVLDNLAKRRARLFSDRGVGPGHRVAMVMPNVPHFPVVYYGALRTGATVVPLSPLMSAVEFEYIFRDCTPTVVVAWSGLHEAAAKAAEAASISFASVGWAEAAARYRESARALHSQTLKIRKPKRLNRFG